MDQSVSISAVETAEAGKTAKKMSFAHVVALPQKDLLAKKLQTVDRNSSDTMATVSPIGSATKNLVESLNDLNISSSDPGNPDNSQFAPKLEDERTHVSFSSVQAPSIASGLALALDEKESIRPDDSASVQLADDDDSNSGPGSGAQNSRLGSEAGAKAFHSQLREISIQRGIPPVAEIQEHPVAPVALQFSYWMPDEKLLEALETSKDRLFLLSLEQQIISFVQSPADDALDLPPFNSFLRLLAHRLADYYRLTHVVDSTANVLRLYKTAGTQLPTPLSAFRPDAASESMSAAIAPSLRIMRRDGLGESGTNTNSNSMVPSKATSEGSEHGDGVVSPAESSSAKDKTQSREQREAKYKEARDRIFAGFKEENEKEPSANASADASRASSVTGNRKKKKKQKDDDFEARSVYFRQQPFDSSQGQGGYFVPYVMQPTMVQPTYNTVYQPQYQVMQPQQLVPVSMVQPPPGTIVYQPVPQQYANYGMPQQQMMGAYYPQVQQQPQMQMQYSQQYVQTPYVQAPTQLSRPGSQMSEQSWSQSSLQSQYACGNPQAQYPAQSPQPIPSPGSNGMSIPYAYGQLPYQPHSPNNRNAHPLPGSYNRSTSYNTQQGRSTSISQTAQHQAQPMQYYSQQIQVPQRPYAAPAYSSQSTNNSKKHIPHYVNSASPSSTISKWGTPPTLPPKPPPPAPAQSAGRVLDGSMPIYQNGTYSKPSNPPHDARAH